MNMEEFEKLVEEAIEELPKEVKERMENVAICVEKRPTGIINKDEGFWEKRSLLGLYEGVPQGVWGRGFGDHLPDKITIFKEPIERVSKSSEEVKETIKKTVYHEIAHHFGFDESEARKIEEVFYGKNRNNQ